MALAAGAHLGSYEIVAPLGEGGMGEVYEAIDPTLDRHIAVLPFTNMSAAPENEFFSDGIAEEIINALSQIDDLHVAARTSAFSFKGKNVDLSEVGRTEAIAVGRWTPSPAERVKVAGALGVSVEAISWGHTMDPRNIRYHQYGMQEDF